MSDFYYQYDLLYEGGRLVDTIRQYMISVIAMSILCGIAALLFHSSPYHGTIKLITGLMVTVTVLKPMLTTNGIAFDKFWNRISADSSYAVRQGQEAAESANSSYIKETMESYIISKAEEMGADITAQVQLQEDTFYQPGEVVISGRVSPYLKKQLSQMIRSELGIEEDQQIWIS